MDMSYGGCGMAYPVDGQVHAVPQNRFVANQQRAAFMSGNTNERRASASGYAYEMNMMAFGQARPAQGPSSASQVPELPLRSAQVKAMEAKVLGRLQEVALRREYANMASRCFDELKDVLAQVGPDWRLRAFGSFANGLCINGSDLDATCYKEEEKKRDDQQDENELKAALIPHLRNHNKFQIVADISHARVPIVKLRFEDLLELDLSFENTEPLLNTQLLKAYGTLHISVKNLCLAVKLWARTAGVCGAKEGNLSSYAITLMVIYFLQVDPQTRLPVLNTSVFNGRASIPSTAKVSWSCMEPLVALLYRFFAFYSGEFQWGAEVVSVRVGRRTSKGNELHSDLQGTWAQRLHIADPFLLPRNLNCVLKEDREQELYEALIAATSELARGAVPPGLSPMKALRRLIAQYPPIAQGDAALGANNQGTGPG